MNPLKYTNGVGHLIMSILMTVAALLLVLFPTDATIKGVGVTLILSVQAAWVIPGSAKQVAHEIVEAINKDAPRVPKISPPGGL